MTDWSQLRHAYGPASDVPDLLAAAGSSDGNEGAVWDDLWSRLCHQGTVYGASYAALPALTDLSVRRAPAGYMAPLRLAAAIIATNDGPEDTAVVRRRYRTELGRLREVAERNLDHAQDDVEFVYGLQAVMAFEDGGVWQRHLEAIADGELSMDCVACGTALVLPLDGPTFEVASPDDGALPPTPVVPYSSAVSGEGARLDSLARRHGRDDLAAVLSALLGRATCPRCGAAFDIPDALD